MPQIKDPKGKARVSWIIYLILAPLFTPDPIIFLTY
jgi:hypothetical protein